MRIHVQMRLRLVAEYLHLVLVETLLRAELQLRGTVLKVHIADGVPHMLAPVAGLGLLERCAATLRETRLRTVARSVRAGQIVGRILGDGPMAPATITKVCKVNESIIIVGRYKQLISELCVAYLAGRALEISTLKVFLKYLLC